jgi:hypothetical protein
MPNYFWQAVCVLSCFAGLQKGIAQDSIVDQDVRVNEQFWIDYNHPSQWSETQSVRTQIAFRTIVPNVFNRFQAISTITFNNTKRSERKWGTIASYQLGGGAIYTQNTEARDNFELRLIQGFKFNIPTIKLVTLNNYVRLEERFQKSFDDNGWRSGFRMRYRLSTNISWGKHYLGFTEGLYFPLQAEIFVNLKKVDRFNDLIRLSPGIGYKFKNNWRYELFVIFNRTRNITETNNKSSDFILRLRVYNGGKKKEGLNDQIDFQLEDGN